MPNLTPQRRRAVVLSSFAAISASAPTLLFSQSHGRGHDFVYGLGLGLAIPLLVGSLLILRRGGSGCSPS